MGDCQNDDLRLGFDHRLKLKFLGSQVTTDAGLLAYGELDETLGLTEMAPDALEDSRVGSNKQHGLLPLLRQSIYSRLAGYEDVNDAERLSVDPAMRHVVGGRARFPEKQAASTSEVGRFETETLSTKSNRRSARPRRLKTLYWGGRNPGVGGCSQENGKIRCARHGGGAHEVTIGDIQSLEWFQAIPNGKSRANIDELGGVFC